ncbi:MAG: universal stress protein [Fimbriimonas sp.]
MKTVIGLDSDELYREAVHLLGRLDFVRNDLILTFVNHSKLSPAEMAVLPPCASSLKLDQVRIDRMFESAGDACDEANLVRDHKERRVMGTPSTTILEIAEDEAADLVAIGSRRRGPLGSAFLGSIGRALAISGESSFLIGRGGTAVRGSVRAVFATDHSPYADRCLDLLLELNPAGLSDIHFVFATELDQDVLSAALGSEVPDERSLDELQTAVRMKGETLVQRTLESGRNADYRIVDDYASDGLRIAMYETRSDILILGSRGHGFLERLVIGSLSLHMVVAEPFSVLVLRLPKEKDR